MKRISRLFSAVAKGSAWIFTVLAAGSIFFPRMTGGSKWQMVLALGFWAIVFWAAMWILSRLGKIAKPEDDAQPAPGTAPQAAPQTQTNASAPIPAPASPAQGRRRKKGRRNNRATP